MKHARHRFIDELAERFASHGAEPYGEAISQAEHALQCATLAERAGCADSLVIAALLHDIGHLYEDPAAQETRFTTPRRLNSRTASRAQRNWPVRLMPSTVFPWASVILSSGASI